MTRHGFIRNSILVFIVLCLFAGLIGTIYSSERAANSTVTNKTAEFTELPQEEDITSNQTSPGQIPALEERSSQVLRCIHYVEKDFKNSVAAAKAALTPAAPKAEVERPDTIIGGVVPHHLLAGKMIAEFFQTLSLRSPKTIVIVGPNHKRTGLNGLHTTTLDWGTAIGVVETNRDLTEKMIRELQASQNDELMEKEHSISALVPFIAYYMPKAKIVPVLLHGNYSGTELQRLQNWLSEAVKDNPDTLVIASVDFSHYLDAVTAGRMDEITLDAIHSRNTRAISKMTNDNIDSPPSILTLLSIIDKLGAVGPEVTGHDNSSNIAGGGADYTTSYYTMLFRKTVEE